jgi:hypothetical protein
MIGEIVISYFGKNYHLNCEEVYSGDTVKRFEITVGEKTMLLERRSGEKIFERRWKIKSVNWEFSDNKTAAEFIHRIMQQLDEDIDGRKSYRRFKE